MKPKARLALLWWCFGCVLFAQTAGTLTGVVRDSSGAVLTGVELSLLHTETGKLRTSASNSLGQFVFPAIASGRYELRASKAGFRPLVRKGIVLTVAEAASLDLVMEIGAIDQVLNIEGQVSPVNTQTGELSYLVGEEAMRELPLNGRNYTDLALLQPGVVAFPHRDGGSVVAHGLGTSVNGQDPRSNVYLLDGTPLNDFTNGPAGSAAGTALGLETIREFRVEVNAYSAEFGRNSGGQITALSKSGGNTPHGSLFYFHRNDNLDARNFFDQAKKPDFKRNQFGATVGGPVRRDRTFFFAGYEGLQDRLGRTISTVVPNAASRQGILPGVPQPIPISPDTKPYLDEYPLPNQPDLGDGLAGYLFGFNQTLSQNFGQGRLDQYIGTAGHLFGRYTFDEAESRLPTEFPQFPRAFVSRNQFATIEYRHILSPRLLSTTRGSFSRTRVGQNVEANTSRPLPVFVPGRPALGNIEISGIPGRFGPQTSVNVTLTQNVFGGSQDFVMTQGRHILKFGGLAERYQDNLFNPTFALGIFTFGPLRNFLENRPVRFLGLTPQGALDRYWRFTLFGFYIQDDYKIHPRLTVNLGLRYEFATMPVDIYGRDSALINLSDPAPTVGQLYQNPTYKNFSPRIGFAYDFGGSRRTALRGGYGWFFNTNNQQNLIVTITNPPATPRVVIANPTFPVPPFERGVGNTVRPVEWNIKNPNVHIWNLNLQREIWFDTLITVGYAGSRGIHLLRSWDVNTPQPQVLPDGTLFWAAGLPRPNRNWATIELKSSDGNSWYNALVFEVRKRWSRGINFQSSYTFSRNIDTTQASTFFSDATNGTTSAMPEFPGFNYNKGLADYHAKNNWLFNLNWELPFAGNTTGVTRQIAHGWQLSGIYNMRAGNPLTAFVTTNRSRSQWSPSLGPGLGQDRPSLAPGFTHETAVRGGPDQYFDPAAFLLQPAGTLGNLGRGTFIGPDLRTLDLAAMKNFVVPKFGDAGRIQFRCEVFNLLNRANFSTPALAAFSGAVDGERPLSSLGRIRATVTSSRQIQFGLRVSF